MSIPPSILELATCGKIIIYPKDTDLSKKITELVKLAQFERRITPENWKLGIVIINKHPAQMSDDEMLKLQNANLVIFVIDALTLQDIKRLNSFGLLPRVRLLRPELIR